MINDVIDHMPSDLTFDETCMILLRLGYHPSVIAAHAEAVYTAVKIFHRNHVDKSGVSIVTTRSSQSDTRERNTPICARSFP